MTVGAVQSLGRTSTSANIALCIAMASATELNTGIVVVSPDWGNGEMFVMGFNRWKLFKTLAAIVGIVGIVSLALIHFIPAPPSKVVMATAFKGASFDYYGRQYRDIFARYNVDLELRETAGAVENVKLLQDPKSGVQIGFVTSPMPNMRLMFCRWAPSTTSRSGFSIPRTISLIDCRNLKANELPLGRWEVLRGSLPSKFLAKAA
jgi:hypothetical protein